MNILKVKEIIEFYKKNFHAISNEEIYKWKAVKRFHDNWNIEADDFAGMIGNSLAEAANLLVSVNYFPKRMITQYADKDPESVRKLFLALYDEEIDWIQRIKSFQEGIKPINDKYFTGKMSYQDARAILVYLALRYPDIYFLYKFTMFKEFAKKVEYPYQPIKGRIENLTVYSDLCELLRDEIVKDNELLELHKERLAEGQFLDSSFNLLTQDVIYAAVTYFGRFEESTEREPALKRLVRVNKPININPNSLKPVLKGSFVNYIESEKRKKKIGNLGELLVLKYEQEKLLKLGIKKQPEHVSLTIGDGLGYDIISFDESGKEIYIEVKTTTRNIESEFFITRNELESSKQNIHKYFLYRLFEYSEKDDSAKLQILKGSLENLCINPDRYRVEVKNND